MVVVSIGWVHCEVFWQTQALLKNPENIKTGFANIHWYFVQCATVRFNKSDIAIFDQSTRNQWKEHKVYITPTNIHLLIGQNVQAISSTLSQQKHSSTSKILQASI